MTLASTRLAAGPGWRVSDVRCAAGPDDPVFEERHGAFCLAAVAAGTFQYRAPTGRTLLAPGAVLLGNQGQCFECGHEHGRGDRCLSVQFDGACWETIVAAVPGARTAVFALPRLPPLPSLLPFAGALATQTDAHALEELAFAFAGAVLYTLVDRADAAPVGARDERRIAASLRRIERSLDTPQPLARLAADAAMSPYHYLRTFTRVVGVTPHRFVTRARLERAMRLLRVSPAPVAQVALDAGFEDLSAFHASFRRWLGTTPAAYRAAGSKGSARRIRTTPGGDGGLDG